MDADYISYESKIISSENMDVLLKLLETVNYGSVTIIVQDGVVVQIEKNEKIRFKNRK